MRHPIERWGWVMSFMSGGRAVRHCVLAGGAMLLWLATADAGGVAITSCVGAGRSVTCVESWRTSDDEANVKRLAPRLTDEEMAEFARRDRLWLARCRPVVRADEFGVNRYYYSAPGCEFGRYE